MNFSGKISNSILNRLARDGADLAGVFEMTDLPPQLLRDPTCWIEARQLEAFLETLERWWFAESGQDDLLERAGHDAKGLQAWGVLDSVLRMIAKPDDILAQPQRFLSYFISPAPPIANAERGAEHINFDLPIFYEEYPKVVTYLRASIEALPTFMGRPMAEVTWQHNHVGIAWQMPSALLADADLAHRQMAPEVMVELMHSLERSEQALLEKSRELERIKAENVRAAKSQPTENEKLLMTKDHLSEVASRVLRLQDYFTRSQQLITLLIGQNRLSPQVREAMRRVNWEQVQELYPKVTSDLMALLEGHDQTEGALNNVQNFQDSSARDSRQSWLPNC